MWVIFKFKNTFNLWQHLIVRRRYRRYLKALADTGSWHRHQFAKWRDSVPFSQLPNLSCVRHRVRGRFLWYSSLFSWGFRARSKSQLVHQEHNLRLACNAPGKEQPRNARGFFLFWSHRPECPGPEFCFPSESGPPGTGAAPARVLQVGTSTHPRRERKGTAFSTFWAILTCSDDESCNVKEAAKLSQPMQQKTTAYI